MSTRDMRNRQPTQWGARIGKGLLIAAIPLFLIVLWMLLIDWPRDVILGVRSIFSGRDVVQVADGEETAVSLFLLLLVIFAVCWLIRLRLPEAVNFWLLTYGLFLWLPAVVALGFAAEYSEQALLTARGYEYCTYHVTATGKGTNGTYVYVRADLQNACAAVKGIFPPDKLIPDRREPFDLVRQGGG